MNIRKIAIVAILIGLGAAYWAVGLYTDWLWFDNLGYSSVFLTMLLSQWGIRFLAWVFFFLFLYLNLISMRDTWRELSLPSLNERIVVNILGRIVTPQRVTFFLFGGSLLLSFLLSSYTTTLWLEARQFFQGVSFGISEPIFQRDVSFYVFQLPFLRSLYAYLLTVVITTILIVGTIYFIFHPPVEVGRRNPLMLFRRGEGHLSLLFALVFLLKAGDYRLQIYELMFSTRGVIFGPGFTDLHANLPALKILFLLALAGSVILIFNIFRRQTRLIFICVGLLVGVSLVAGSIYPALIQKFKVDPNEMVCERPFLEHNINFTLKAFDLDNIRKEKYPVSQTLDWEALESASSTLQNVRLWDYRPLLQTYNQLQGFRRYYEFVDVDTDRYFIDGEYKQVMLAARELNQNLLDPQAKTWVNLHLQYTHGYGLTMSPVARVTPQGLPEFNVRDIPLVSKDDLAVECPGIYYGELSGKYVIVNTKTPEFDYSQGDTNAYIHYEGKGGVLLDNPVKRLLYALKFSDYRIFLSGEITGESRIMFNRSIQERVNTIAPFLKYDGDPYLVIDEGKLFWILDAYTTSNCFPYSKPYGEINYMRNSVKVVVDAYEGTIDFFLVDPSDPFALTYANIFPGLFKPFEEMPTGLKEHLRYPEVYLHTQARIYATFHMQDPVVFYNKEDLWNIPNEKYAGATQAMEPYYTILQLPGKTEPEFVLILPFTPGNRDNMIAWMAGRCDGENYGELLVYDFPKDKVIYGPMQIETRIDQNTLISQQLSLWDQKGSRVIRGNLLVLPVGDSILYVEPVFLEADQSQLPELARVIVGFHEKVVMEPTLGEALISLFGSRETPDPGVTDEPEKTHELGTPGDPPALPATFPELAARAQQQFEQAQEKMKEGDWAGYGKALDELGKTLQELNKASEGL